MRDTIKVWYNGLGYLISSVVAINLGIKDGHLVLTEEQFWRILNENASYNILICDSQLQPKN